MRVVLVSCGKKKLDHSAKAADLYQGNLFRAAREYAEIEGVEWWVISALYGLVDPDQPIGPYNVTMRDLTPMQRAAWGLRACADLIDALHEPVTSLTDLEVEIHAGAAYADYLVGPLHAFGVKTSQPLRGLGTGQRLSWYRRHHDHAQA